MGRGATLLGWAKGPPIDVTPHLEPVTTAIWIAVALIVLFFVVRPELWRRLWFHKVDPRPAALLRIAFGTVVLWTFLDLWVLLGEFLFTDEGLYMTEMARKNYGGRLKELWDPEHGFQHWYDPLYAMWGKFSILHFRSDKPFTYGVFTALTISCTAMIVGFRTRAATIVTWFLVNSIYNYNPIYYTGGDTVLRCYMFFAIFLNWGETYSVDGWLRRRRAVLREGASKLPAPRRIASWPLSIMMLQLALIYCATGVLKSGKTWADGTALYFALNLDHFYRWPTHRLIVILDYLHITRISAIAVHWWEVLFPLALLGKMLQVFEADVRAKVWPKAATWRKALGWLVVASAIGVGTWIGAWATFYYYVPPDHVPVPEAKQTAKVAFAVLFPLSCASAVGAYALLRKFPRRRQFLLEWILGRRFWLGFGVLFHIGIDLGMNVGTFVQVMWAVYLAWITGDDAQAWWRFCLWRPARAGHHGRPAWPRSGPGRALAWMLAPLHRASYRVRPDPVVVLHGADESSVRRAALLRCWDLGERLSFESQRSRKATGLRVDARVLEGDAAGRTLIRLLPGLWLLWPISMIPGVGKLALRLTGQSARVHGVPSLQSAPSTP